MSTTSLPNSMVSICTCGRSYAHCRKCGKRNPYVKRLRSSDLSLELGQKVLVYRCQRCSEETHTAMPCVAPLINDEPGEQYIPFIKSKSLAPLPLWGMAVPGSDEHARLLSDWVVEQNKKHSYGAVQVYIEAQKAGWHLEFFGEKLDDDIKKALEERGLWPQSCPTEGDAQDQSVIGSGGDLGAKEASLPTEPVGLDEIIQRMQEESK